MLTRLTVVIILQYTQISNHYVLHLKLIWFYTSITPQLKKQQAKAYSSRIQKVHNIRKSRWHCRKWNTETLFYSLYYHWLHAFPVTRQFQSYTCSQIRERLRKKMHLRIYSWQFSTCVEIYSYRFTNSNAFGCHLIAPVFHNLANQVMCKLGCLTWDTAQLKIETEH